MQPFPQYRPGPAVRPSLSPRGRKKGGEREGSEVTREGCVGWAETAVVLCHQSVAWGEVDTLKWSYSLSLGASES